MTAGPDHYLLAEDLLAQSHTIGADDLSPAELLAATLAKAQVHATLALAAAVGLNDAQEGMPVTDSLAWAHVAGVAAKAAQS